MTTISQALAALRPGEPFVMSGDDVSTVVWDNPATATPSLKELQSEVTRLAQAAHVLDDNRATLTDRAATALQGNRDYLAIATPTNAQIAAQVKALTRQSSALIRLLTDALDATD